MTPKTVAQWRQPTPGTDAPMRPKPPHATVLTTARAALSMACRRHPRPPLADGLSAWPAIMPHRTRAARHRCVQRHGLNRWPEIAGEQPTKNKFTPDPIGSCQIAMAEGRPAADQLGLFVAIDRPCQCASAERYEGAHKRIAAQFLRHLGGAVPDTIPTVLTDHGIQVTNRWRDHYAFQPICARVGQEQGREQRLTPGNHPWTNGQVERMRRTVKEVTVQRDDDQPHPHLQAHLQACLMADHVATRRKTLTGLTPYEDLCHGWHTKPERLTTHPYHHILD